MQIMEIQQSMAEKIATVAMRTKSCWKNLNEQIKTWKMSAVAASRYGWRSWVTEAAWRRHGNAAAAAAATAAVGLPSRCFV